MKIEYVSQKPFLICCQQACIAMLSGKSLSEIISLSGYKKLRSDERSRVLEKYNIEISSMGYIVEGVGDNCIGALIKKHNILWCNLSSWKDPNYAHAVIIADETVFDPLDGINPKWDCDKYISFAFPITKR